MILFVLCVLAVSGGIIWMAAHHSPASTADAGDRKILYYTCSMHPWVREHKPGPCPVCGMELVPIYEPGEKTNLENGAVTLDSESISAINVQTETVAIRPVRRTLHLSGKIIGNSWQVAWFEFTAYERDFQWLKVGETFDVKLSAAPDKIYRAQIKLHGVKDFADRDLDTMTDSTEVRAEILNPPVQPADFGKNRLFNGLHAEAHVVAETENVLAVPRSAIISRGSGAMVYVDKGDGHYAPRAILPGRIGDDYAEVTAGLKEGERVVTTGNVLIDSAAQLTAGD